MEVQKYLGSSDPKVILNQWMQEAQKCSEIKEPGAIVLSTVSKDQVPFSRVVLIKEINDAGLIFYTNVTSRKGMQLENNSSCCGHIYWDFLFKQVSITGQASKISYEKTQSYWKQRPRESQLSQCISNQSSEIPNREYLNELRLKEEEKWKGKDIECPKNWSGYQLRIENIEFWIGRDHRLHDRFLFTKQEANQWKVSRLSP